MRSSEVKRRLRAAAEHAAPDDLEQILSSCDGQKGKVIEMQTPKQKKRTVPVLAALAAALVLVCAGVFGWTALRGGGAVADTVITIDVNPSVALTVDGKEKVTSAAALNADGETVLEGMDLRGTDLNVAVNAIIGSMLQNGYLNLDNFENAILISVEGGDVDRAARLRQQVSDTVSGMFSAGGSHPMNALILSQTVSAGEELTALAAQYGISEGKAALIREVAAQDDTLTLDTLAPLTINEIALIADARGLTIRSVSQTGEASQAAYIGAQTALERACTGANVPVDGALDAEVEFDCENGVMVYGVEFCYGGTEYDCEIDACTGAVLRCHRETCGHSHHAGHHGGPSPAASAAPGAYIGEEAASAAALAHAGVSAADTDWLSCRLEYENGVPEHYEVEFLVGRTQYEYEIGLYDGAVLDFEREVLPDRGQETTPPPAVSTRVYIGEDAAFAAACAHVGCAAGDTLDFTCHLDYENGYPECYEVEFCHNGVQYEYEIDPYTGAVLHHEWETCDHSGHSHGAGHHGESNQGSPSPAASTAVLVGEEAARIAALGHVGCAAADTADLTCHLDYEDGHPECYEVEFCHNGIQHEYEIDPYTGAVLHHEQESCSNSGHSHGSGHHSESQHGGHHG